MEAYVKTGKVQIVWHNFAWIGNESRRSAEASACAHAQGKFWEYHTTLFQNQRGYNGGGFNDANLKQHAAAVGLDESAFGACLAQGTYADVVAAEFAAARELGITATPTLIVDGQRVVGPNYERLALVIEQALKAKGQ